VCGHRASSRRGSDEDRGRGPIVDNLAGFEVRPTEARDGQVKLQDNRADLPLLDVALGFPVYITTHAGSCMDQKGTLSPGSPARRGQWPRDGARGTFTSRYDAPFFGMLACYRNTWSDERINK
jgi:hypothetical protein